MLTRSKFMETTDKSVARGEDYDPVSDFIDTPEMKDALGNMYHAKTQNHRRTA